MISLLSIITGTSFATGGALGFLRNLLDIAFNKTEALKPESRVDPVALLNAQTLNLQAETELVKARDARDHQSALDEAATMAPPSSDLSPNGFDAMKWCRFGFSMVAILIFLVLGGKYAVFGQEAVSVEAGVLTLTLIGNIAGYFFTTRHFGAKETL